MDNYIAQSNTDSDEPILCKICGHDADVHFFYTGEGKCLECPDHLCQPKKPIAAIWIYPDDYDKTWVYSEN